MWKAFHHPDICLPVVQRRLGLELLETLEFLGDMAVHHVHALMRNRSYPNRASYYNAVGRLSKLGLVVRDQGLDTPRLRISEQGAGSLADYLRPDKWWGRKWNGIWYLLVYDVPEADRPYRNVLRRFLRQQRMGCFQKSVWITPRDIRPEYSDLEEAAAVDVFACLFEACTVLGMPSEKVVRESWDFDALYGVQKRFCDIYSENLRILREAVSPGLDALIRLATEEIDAYRSAFVNDPLLPEGLLPATYMGRQAYSLHLEITSAIRKGIQVL